MTTKTWQRIFSIIVLAGLLLSLTNPGAANAKTSGTNPAAPAAADKNLAKIEGQVLDEMAAKGQADFFVIMKAQADLSSADSLKTKVQKGDFVYNTLRVTADQAQKGLRKYLDGQGVQYTSYYIINAILVKGGTQELVTTLAARSDVAQVSANHTFTVDPDKPLAKQAGPETQAAPAGVEPNLLFVKADQVWALGDTGQGAVLAGNDTGLVWDHAAIQAHYRGWNGSTADHNYNWWSAVPGSYPAPVDAAGLGTYATGIMVGDDGAGNQIGMAPGAKTIQCKNTTWQYDTQDAWYLECFEWDLAPWDLNHSNPRPDLAPDAVNLNWKSAFGQGNTVFRVAVDNLQAAGVVVDVPAGDFGDSCSTIYSPGDYQEAMTTGSVGMSGGALPGSLSSFSNRGPSQLDGNYFPDVVAPGENIRSSFVPNNGNYTTMNSTRAASPHVTGLIGLIWSANPALRGQVDATLQIIKDTAVPLSGQGGLGCGGDYTTGPNNDWGYGTIDALAAVQAAMNFHAGTLQGAVTQSVGGAPAPGATIQATLSATQTYQTTADATGLYSMNLISGTYTVDASAYGYLPAQASGVMVAEELTTTLNFALDTAPSHVLSVTVVDANTGWPLYAVTSLGGTPLDPVWNDPVTGHFQLSLPDGWVYTLGVDTWSSPDYYIHDYIHKDVTVGPFYSDTELVIELEPDLSACTAPGYGWVLSPTFSSDFEADNGGFYTGGSSSSWEWGVPINGPGAAHSGENAWATNLDGNYNRYENSYLYSPTIDLSSLAGKRITISWWQWRQMGSGDYIYLQFRRSDGYWDSYSANNQNLYWAQDSITLDSEYAISNFRMRFNLEANGYYTYPGWYVDDVQVGVNVCTPMAGGLVVGNVYDANAGTPVAGATVANDSGFSTQTAATIDPNVDDGFYILFSPQAEHTFTASYSSFIPDMEAVAVPEGGAVRQDFHLTAGRLTFNPLEMQVNLEMGSQLTQTLNIANDGSGPASYALSEYKKGFQPANAFVSNTPADGPHVLLLSADYLDGDACQPLMNDLWIMGGLGSVTCYDARYSTPSLDELKAYDSVLTWNNLDYADPVTLGDELADYVDAGGKVIDLLYSMNPSGLAGRFMSDDYTAMKGTGSTGYSCLDVYDASHPIMQGVSNLCDYTHIFGSYLTPDSTGIAYWEDGEILAAVKNNRTVVSMGVYDGTYADYSYQRDLMVHNAVLWLFVPTDVPWLSETPITGTIPISGSQDVTVSFNAGVPEIDQPGTYLAELKVSSDTPYPATKIPITMTVTAPPTFGKLEGTVQSLGYCNANPAPRNQADVKVESSLGVTWMLKTDANGRYQVWMDQANSPMTVTVSTGLDVGQTVTNVMIVGQQTTAANFDLLLDEPCVTETPPSFSVDLPIGSVTSTQMTLTNTGGRGTGFSISEFDQGNYPAASTLSIPASQGNFEHTPAHFGQAPRSNAPAAAKPSAAQTIPALVGKPAYAVDLMNDQLVYLPNTTQPGSWNVIGSVLDGMFAGDFLNGDFSKLYVLNYGRNALYTIDTSTGAATRVGSSTPLTGQYWLGLTASTQGILYAVSSNDYESTLYTIDSATGAATILASISGGCITDIAINPAGELYGINICDDLLIRIDPATGDSTTIGSLGVDADYAQGIDFDDSTGVLYWASWNYHVDGGELRIIDTNTGSSTSVGVFPGADEADCLAIATVAPTDVPWMTEQPITGTLAAVIGHQDITVNFDASQVDQPGHYLALLSVTTDDPLNGASNLPVELNVSPTLDWGQLEGSVTGLGYCDQESIPLAGAQIRIESANGLTYTLKTDDLSNYQRWLLVADGPYTVTASADGYQASSVGGVQIPGLGTIPVNLELRWLQPCMRVHPGALAVDVLLGSQETANLYLFNQGAGPSGFALSDQEVNPPSAQRPARTEAHPVPAGVSATQPPAGYTPSLTRSAYAPANPLGGTVAVFKDADPWDTTEVEYFLAANNISYEVHTSAEFGTLDFSNYSMIVFSSDQTQTFYNAYASYINKFEAYVEAGGFLNFFTAPGWNGGMLNAPLPGGMTWSEYYEYYNVVNDPAHPVMAGLTNPFYGPWEASFGHFDNLPAYAHIIASELSYGMPTIVEYPIGNGWLIAFGQPLEISHYYGWDIGQIMENTLLWGNAFQPVYDAPWLAETPITGTLAHDSSVPVEVTFTAFPTMTVGGIYTATLVVKSDDPLTPTILIPVSMHVLAPVYGVAISPDDSLTGLPGETVVYTVTITNTSVEASDSFTLSLSGGSWTAALEVTQVGPLAPGESEVVQVSVTVPPEVVLPAQDSVQVTATSHGDAGVSATASLTTVAGGLFGVDLAPETSAGSGKPGEVITYNLRLTNTGTTTDTIVISVTGGTAAWVSLPQNTFVLASGEAVDVLVVVHIPPEAVAGDYPIDITATSAHDPTQTDQVTITTTVMRFYIYLPLVWRTP